MAVWRHLNTLRFKLSALNLAVFGLLLILLNAAILIVREQELRHQFDMRLQDRAELIVGEMATPGSDRSNVADSGSAAGFFNRFRFPGYFFQLCSVDGDVLEKSRSLAEWALPLKRPAAARTAGAVVFETIRGGIARVLVGDGAAIRLLTLYHDEAGEPPFYLQMAVSTEALELSIRHLRRVVWLMGLGALLIAGVASSYLAGRALAPLARVAEVADQLQVGQFAPRFETPPGGDEVADMVSRINAMLDRLAASFHAHGRFIADAAHELKTPLAVLLGEAQVLMQQERSPEELNRFVADVQDGVRSLTQTLDSLLTLARSEAGIPAAHVSQVVVNEMVMDAVERCSTAAAQREVRLAPQLVLPDGDEADVMVQGDGALLRLMISNLIRNAIRYSPPDETVDVAASVDSGGVVLAVRDRGPGIPAEFHDKVFDRFFRVDDASSSFKGAGLGLTIVRGVARLHGGDVQVRNHPDGGCEFTVRLPQAVEAEGGQAPPMLQG